jgi:valacyclovir hydrolase
LPKLLPDYQIIAWDPPGQGRSIPPERIYTKNWLEVDADVVFGLMEVLGIPKFDILGWSNGGITGLILSAKHPECVDKMAIFGAIAYMTQQEMKIYDYAIDVKNWATHLRKPKEDLYGFEYLQRKYREDIEMARIIFKENKGDICRDLLKFITAETLILHGERDLLVSKDQVPFLLKNIANSRLIKFPQGSHDIHFQYPEEFNNHVVEFFKKQKQ